MAVARPEAFLVHRKLRRYNGMTGQLTLDYGTIVPVQVRGPFLREIDTPRES